MNKNIITVFGSSFPIIMNLIMVDRMKELFKCYWKKSVLIIFTAAFIYFNLQYHLAVGNFVTHFQETPFGKIRPRDLAPICGYISLFFLIVFIFIKFLKGKRIIISLVYFLLFIAILFIIRLYLMVHPVEYAHYFQYGLLAILFGLIIDPKKENFRYLQIFFLSSMVGLFDELYQYFYHCPGYCRYFDYTDVAMNILAAGGGGLIYYGFKDSKEKKSLTPIYYQKKFVFIIFFVCLLIFANLTGYFKFTTTCNVPPGGFLKENNKTSIVLEREKGVLGSWQKTFFTGYFYVFTPYEGFLFNILIYIAFATFDINFLRYFRLKNREIKKSNK